MNLIIAAQTSPEQNAGGMLLCLAVVFGFALAAKISADKNKGKR